MKTVILSALLSLSFVSTSFAGTTPWLPCYVDGEYIGNIMITECRKQNGKVYKNEK
ncbi:hypothetical protein [Vibrio comitans]